MSSMLLTLGVAQATSRPTLSATLSHLTTLAEEAASNCVGLLLLPEAFLGGYPRGSSFDSVVGSRTPSGRAEFAAYAEQCPDFGDVCHEGAGEVYEREGDGTRQYLENLAKKTGVFLVVGCVERCVGTLYCGVVYVDPERGMIGKRRKLMPTASERLIWGFGSSQTLKAITTKIKGIEVTMAAAICWENYMPLLRYTLYSQHVQIYLAPTADGRESWISTMRHIAMEGRCFVLGANQYVPPKNENKDMTSEEHGASQGGDAAAAADRTSCRGGSVIVGPMGQILAGPMWAQEGMLTVGLDDMAKDVMQGKMDFDVVGHYKGPWKLVRSE